MKLWEWFKEISMIEFEWIYQLLGIEFDSYVGESFYRDKVPALVENVLYDACSLLGMECPEQM